MKTTKLKVLREGDEVVRLEDDRVYIKRKSGEYDVLVIRLYENDGLPIVDYEIISITRGSGGIEIIEDEDACEDVEVPQSNAKGRP